ncbi:MAG: GNAT family N-acetyltransferase [Candidatus Lokiarchaeota archaeon]|nr:GNAT family N-acetyltransferase [Candidatus Lokiarchaeota archaeon]MBD3200878.1 GNAT family N-acetyltransferase [Candidatus Lokiarchaeota archaeon]
MKINKKKLEWIRLPSNEKQNTIGEFLEGDRVSLVPLHKEHLDLYTKWRNRPKVRRLARSNLPTTKEDLEKFLEPKNIRIMDNFYFEIFHKKDEKPIGDAGFNKIEWIDKRGDIGLAIGEPEYWRQGYATEATELLLRYAFNELNLNKITATIYSPNIGSYICAEKVGLKLEARLEKDAYIEGKYVDNLIYRIFKDEWIEKNKTN